MTPDKVPKSGNATMIIKMQSNLNIVGAGL